LTRCRFRILKKRAAAESDIRAVHEALDGNIIALLVMMIRRWVQ
jgi:hypothetical protein